MVAFAGFGGALVLQFLIRPTLFYALALIMIFVIGNGTEQTLSIRSNDAPHQVPATGTTAAPDPKPTASLTER